VAEQVSKAGEHDGLGYRSRDM